MKEASPCVAEQAPGRVAGRSLYTSQHNCSRLVLQPAAGEEWKRDGAMGGVIWEGREMLFLDSMKWYLDKQLMKHWAEHPLLTHSYRTMEPLDCIFPS